MIGLGTVIHVTSSKRLIVQSNKIPRLGSLVFNNSEKVGIIKDIFGPKAHPFISISPSISLEKANELVGKKLFYREKQWKKRNKKPQHRSSQGPRKKTRRSTSP